MRTKKALKNLIFNFIQQLIQIVVNFVMTPMLISTFGSTVNGLVSTIRQIMSYVQLTGAGIAQASTFAMYQPLANEDYATLNGIYSATKYMFVKAGNVFSVLVLFVALIYPFFVQADIDYWTVFFLVVVIGVSGASEFYLCGKYQAILSANQENFVVAIAQTLGNLTNLIVFCILITLNQNIVIIQLGMSSIYLLRILILTMYVQKKYKFLNNDSKPLFEKITQRGDALIHQISTLVVLGSSTIVVSVVVGLKEASVFSVYLIVFQGINTICAVVSNAIYASFGEVIARKETNTLQKSFDIYEFLYFMVITVVFSCTFVLIMPFISIYTQNMVDINYIYPTLALLFIIVGISNNIRIPASTLVSGAGHFKETKYRAIFEAVLNIFGQVLFGYLYGMNGVLLGCILSYSYRTIDFIVYVHKYILNSSSIKTFKRILQNIIIGVVAIILINIFLRYDIQNYFEWIQYGTLYFIIISLIVILFNAFLEKSTFLSVVGIFKTILGR